MTAKTSPTAEILGYTVTKTDGPHTAYELQGRGGARYGLVRLPKNPSMLFPINIRPAYYGVVVTLKGNGWVRELEDGTLEVVS